MRAGSLDEWVEIQERVETVKPGGHESVAWRAVARVWASVEQLKAEEKVEAQTTRGFMTHRIRMRYYPGLTAKHRITHDGVEFNIDSVVQGFGRRRETQALAVQVE